MHTTDLYSGHTVIIDHSLLNKQAKHTAVQTSKQAKTGMQNPSTKMWIRIEERHLNQLEFVLVNYNNLYIIIGIIYYH